MATSNRIPTDFDIAVIGGGINGAGVAREAAYRGYRVVLLEKDDFGGATSANSSKLIHGGIRYLESGDFRLVAESLRERRTLLNIAPHLVTPLKLVIPVYKGAVRPAWMVRIGTLIYDVLAGRRSLGRSRFLHRRDMLQIPLLNKEDLASGVAYFDAQAFDSRLTIETILSAEEAGASVHNYAPVSHVRLAYDRYEIDGEDRRTGQPYRLTAKAVVNATGPWAPFVERNTGKHPTRPLAYDSGIHFVIPGLGIPHGIALMAHDRRLIFVLPWREHYTLIGTTERHYEGHDFTHVQPSEEEIEYLLDQFNAFFPARRLKREQILYIYAGVRTLTAGTNRTLTTLSRESEVMTYTDAPGTAWVILYGGKLTSYRSHAVKVVDALKAHVPPPAGAVQRYTALVPLFGGGTVPEAEAARYAAIDAVQREVWRKRYGSRWIQVAQRAQESPRMAEILVASHRFTWADLAYMVEVEKAWQLKDVTLRRTTLIYDMVAGDAERLAAALRDLSPEHGIQSRQFG